MNFQGSIFGQSVAIRLGLSESDIDALELLIDTGAATAGKLSEVMGLTTGAVTRVIDRLEQAGYVRRTADPADRRRVVIEVVPERVATVESLLDSLGTPPRPRPSGTRDEQLATINDFLSRMADLTQTEATRIRDRHDGATRRDAGRAVRAHRAAGRPRRAARLLFRAGRAGPAAADRARSGRTCTAPGSRARPRRSGCATGG